MVKRSPPVGLLYYSLLFDVLLAPQYSATAEPFPRKVLLLTYYHQGDRWNDSVVRGVREALGSLESVNLSIENLDLRRYTDPDPAGCLPLLKLVDLPGRIIRWLSERPEKSN